MHIVEKCILPLCRLEVCPGANALKARGQRIKVPQALGRRMTQMLEGAARHGLRPGARGFRTGAGLRGRGVVRVNNP